MSNEAQLTRNPNMVNRGNGTTLQRSVIGTQNKRSSPATILRAGGCSVAEGAPGVQVITASIAALWGPGAVPTAAGAKRSYLVAGLKWYVGNSTQVAEVDLRQGSQIAVPAEALDIRAWIQEFEPDPGIQIAGGGIAPQAGLDPDLAFDSIEVMAGIGASSGCSNASRATKTYPQQSMIAGQSLFYRVPAFGDTLQIYWGSVTLAPGDAVVRLKTAPTADGQTVREFDGAALQALVRPVIIPGGVTHVEIDVAVGPQTPTPVFTLNL